MKPTLSATNLVWYTNIFTTQTTLPTLVPLPAARPVNSAAFSTNSSSFTTGIGLHAAQTPPPVTTDVYGCPNSAVVEYLVEQGYKRGFVQKNFPYHLRDHVALVLKTQPYVVTQVSKVPANSGSGGSPENLAIYPFEVLIIYGDNRTPNSYN